MRSYFLKSSLMALCLGAAMSVGAQSTAPSPPPQYQPAGTPSAYDQNAQSVAPSPAMNGRQFDRHQVMGADQTPPSGMDSTAYTQCHGLVANDYWDCVNSHDGGGGQ